MMWIVIAIVTMIAAILGLIYLVNKIYRLNPIKKAFGNNKAFHIMISLLIIILLCTALWLVFDMVNAIICVLFLVAFLLLFDLFGWIIKKVGGKMFLHNQLELIALVCTICYLGCGWYLAHNVWKTNYNISTDKAVGQIRVVLFADSHIGTTFDGDEFAEYVSRMQQEKPDVVVIAGDFVDDYTTKEDMIKACAALGELDTNFGIYYAFGNHDKGYYGEAHRGYSGDDLVAELEKNDVIVMQDESILIDNRFYIIGRQDLSENLSSNKRADITSLTDNLDKDKYMIVLDHQPSDYENEAKSNVDLVLSGHTHGGQLFPATYVGEWIGANDRTYGREKRNSTEFIVTSGIADWAIDFKTGCKSEYVVIDINGR